MKAATACVWMMTAAVAGTMAAEHYFLSPRVENACEAIESGDVEELRPFLNNPEALNAPGKIGRTPLEVAVWTSQPNMLSMLLNSGAEPDRLDAQGYSPMSCAAARGDLDAMSLLLHAGADLNCRQMHRSTALFDAVTCMGSLRAVNWMLEHGADPNLAVPGGSTCLHQAAERGDAELIRTLLAHGAKADARDGQGLTPLDAALLADQSEAAQTLLLATLNVPLAVNDTGPACSGRTAHADALVDQKN